MILVAKVPRFGAITTIGLVIALFFLGTKHGAGSFLPGIICGLLADGVAHLGKYKDKTKNFLSFIIFAFSTTGPILLMWIAPKAYMATPNPGTVLLFIASIVIGALVGALIGQALSKKFAQKI